MTDRKKTGKKQRQGCKRAEKRIEKRLQKGQRKNREKDREKGIRAEKTVRDKERLNNILQK